MDKTKNLGLFERYLSLWVGLGIVVGILVLGALLSLSIYQRKTDAIVENLERDALDLLGYIEYENNTFLIRSANKGISAIIDNKGNTIKQLDRNEAGSIELEVPLIKSKKIKNDLIFFILLITYTIIFLIMRKINE